MVYTDGSRFSDDKAGTGFFIFQMSRQISSGACPLRSNNEMVDSESHAALYGTQSALSFPTILFPNSMWLFTDNQNVEKTLSKHENFKYSKNAFEEIIEAKNTWKSPERLPKTRNGEIKIIWIPRHSGIEGNKLADLQSKKGASTPEDDQPEHDFASLESWHTRHIQNARKFW